MKQGCRLWMIALLLGSCAGCATVPCSHDTDVSRSLQTIPEIPRNHIRADRALVDAFFAANGIDLSTSEVEAIISTAALQGRINRAAIRRIAKQHGYRLIVIKADERFLWEELGDQLPLLVLLPPGSRYSSSRTPLIPIAWDGREHTIDLIDGNGEIRTLSETDFFARREPLKQAALCLVKSGGFRPYEPAREQRLLLADFWFDQSFYRNVPVEYTAIEDIPLTGTDMDTLIERGKLLIRKGRYPAAIPVFRAALELDPDNPIILNNLAYTMLRGNGELLVALRHASKALELDPDNPLILETLGSINLRVGDAPAAARHLEHALGRALRRSPEIQIAIMDQLVRAWLAADREDLAWQVAEYRYQTFSDYRFPKDILISFPALNRVRLMSRKKIMLDGG